MRSLRHNVSGQAGAVVHIPGAGGRGGDSVGGGQRGLDFGELDAESAHLHLMVGTTDELQSAVFGPPGQVAAAIQPAAGFVAKRIGNEPRRRSARAASSSRGPTGHRRNTIRPPRRPAPAADRRRADRPAHRPPASRPAGSAGSADPATPRQRSRWSRCCSAIPGRARRMSAHAAVSRCSSEHAHRLATAHQPRQRSHRVRACCPPARTPGWAPR